MQIVIKNYEKDADAINIFGAVFKINMVDGMIYSPYIQTPIITDKMEIMPDGSLYIEVKDV